MFLVRTPLRVALTRAIPVCRGAEAYVCVTLTRSQSKFCGQPFLSFRKIPQQRLCSSAKVTTSTGSSSQKRTASKYAIWNNKKFRIFFRVTRNLILLGSIGGTCYALGQIEYIEDPEGFERKTINALLNQEGVKQMLSVDEDRNMRRDAYFQTGGASSAYVFDAQKEKAVGVDADNPIWVTGEKAQKVFKRIKLSSQEVLRATVRDIENVIKENEESASGENAALLLLLREELFILKAKQAHLSRPWKIIVTDNELPNAYVNGFLPRRIFLTKGLLQEFCITDEELALVLSHELSHFLLGHTKDILMINAVAQVIAVSLISIIDPTGGLASFIMELAVPWFGTALGASFSREQEHQADNLGFQILSNACYDPEKALQIFGNMQAFTDKMKEKGYGVMVPMLNTHPMDEDRYRAQMEKLDSNRGVYKENGCNESLIERFYNIWNTPHPVPRQPAEATRLSRSWLK